MMTLFRPQFLYPQSRQFPFDEVCERIVRALEARNWDVPGISVEFHVYGTGDAKYRMVSYLRGDDFKLWFCRPQARLGNWNDTAAVSEIVIPKKELHVYEDESGPSLYVYVGRSWKRDRDRFMNGVKVNSKLNGERRTYLKYSGACRCQATARASFDAVGFLTAAITGDTDAFQAMTHTHSGARSPLLLHDNDLGREYEPTPNEPREYRTDDVFAEFTRWLEDNLLARILAQPEAAETIDRFTETVTPFPETAGPIFCFGNHQDAERISKGRRRSVTLDPGDRYAFTGGGYRLLSLSVPSDDSVPDVAYDGFEWCGFGEVSASTPIDSLTVPGHYRWSDKEQFVFRVTPNRADGIYVADHAPFEKRRQELFTAIAPRDRLTDAELNEAYLDRARTIVPITEYTGGYEQPIVLVNRELGFDEVELVSGPWPACAFVTHMADHSPRSRELLDQALMAYGQYLLDLFSLQRRDRRQFLDGIIVELAELFADDPELGSAAERLSHSGLGFTRQQTLAQVIDNLVTTAYRMRGLGLY